MPESMTTMQAAVFEAKGKISLREVPKPVPGLGEALIRVTLTTICGTDVHILRGEYPVKPGLTVGHEPVGVIDAVGPGVVGYAPGDRVVVLNHPRDLHAGFRPFDPSQFNPVTGRHRRVPALGVDAIEVLNSGAMQSDPLRPLLDWMALLNRGERTTAVASSMAPYTAVKARIEEPALHRGARVKKPVFAHRIIMVPPTATDVASTAMARTPT